MRFRSLDRSSSSSIKSQCSRRTYRRSTCGRLRAVTITRFCGDGHSKRQLNDRLAHQTQSGEPPHHECSQDVSFFSGHGSRSDDCTAQPVLVIHRSIELRVAQAQFVVRGTILHLRRTVLESPPDGEVLYTITVKVDEVIK